MGGGVDESPDLKPVQHKYDIQSVKQCSQGNTTKYKQKSKESFGRLGFVCLFLVGGAGADEKETYSKTQHVIGLASIRHP